MGGGQVSEVTCHICGGPTKPLFNVGFFCPKECDRKPKVTKHPPEATGNDCPRCKSTDTEVFADPWGTFAGKNMRHCWPCGAVWEVSKC